jgi:lipoprotein-releasing system permease protein
MPFELKLALKYFRARRKSLARFTSLVAVVGIAAGVASLIIAQALARGFSEEMQDKILGNTAHVSVFHNDGAEISNWRETKENLERTENVKEVSATTYESAIISSKDAVNYAVLRVVSSQDKQLTIDNRQPTTDISLGERLAEKTNLKQGDEAEIITLENQSEPKRTRVHIAQTFQTGIYEYDSTWIRVSPEDFMRLKGQSNFAPSVLNVSVKDIYKADKTAKEIGVQLGESYNVVDWQEANQPLFAALSLERKVALAIISLIIFIAALNITTTLALLVGERRLDIAVLRTCGAKTRNLIFVFLFEGLFLGFLGILFGIALGLLGCFAGNRFKIISLSAEVYSLSYIPLRPNLIDILLIIFIAFLLCLSATIYPAFKASRVKPLETLRMQ